MVESGRLGRKSDSGFYRYERGRRVGVADASAVAPSDHLTDTQIVERIELAIINEAYHAAGEGVADPIDIDRAMRLGARHPYGPFERAGQLGLRAVVQGLHRLEQQHGQRFRVAPALWQVAAL
jgi:3-hydroxyacyl-CoA dehydrogenase